MCAALAPTPANVFCEDNAMKGFVRLLIAVIVAFSVALPLAACGKKGDLDAPPGSTYPDKYPRE